MRIVVLTLILLLLIPLGRGLAIFPVTPELITEAQEYGITRVSYPLTDLLAPWLVYEKKALKSGGNLERACMYTPFLLVALDAREKSLKGYRVTVAESQEMLTEYDGFLVFRVTVFGDDPCFVENTAAHIKQGGRIIKAAQSLVPLTGTWSEWFPASPLYMAECYFYFEQKGVNPRKPATLNVITNDERKRYFNFELAKIK